MVLLWIVPIVGGLALALLGSRQTLDAAQTLASKLGMSPFLVGMTVVAFGTDLPEIANSITASASGHGDINVGDSIGSTVTQLTLVLGLLCFLGPVVASRKLVATAGFVTVLAVLVGAMLLDDGRLDRFDGLTLLAFWVVGTLATQRVAHIAVPAQRQLFGRGAFSLFRDLLVGLSAVALGSVAVVLGFTELAEAFGVPEYATSFLVLSLGTSLPELMIDGAAIRQGQSQLALGDIVGSSFVDATVSLGIGPALFPIAVSANASTGSLIAAAIVAATIGFLLLRETHDKRSGVVLIGLYLTSYVILAL